jgi:hypothetical protein
MPRILKRVDKQADTVELMRVTRYCPTGRTPSPRRVDLDHSSDPTLLNIDANGLRLTAFLQAPPDRQPGAPQD